MPCICASPCSSWAGSSIVIDLRESLFGHGFGLARKAGQLGILLAALLAEVPQRIQSRFGEVGIGDALDVLGRHGLDAGRRLVEEAPVLPHVVQEQLQEQEEIGLETAVRIGQGLVLDLLQLAFADRFRL